ncbi:hypothetical protein HJC23_011889 [Cyclotella cryptica]|uniref:SAP domain-containing protein n=1 Tax=Cyclotella cryptica TaxID=29204 RepID=A0ABD3PKI8_9STRA
MDNDAKSPIERLVFVAHNATTFEDQGQRTGSAENSGSESDIDKGNTDVQDHPDNGENGDSDDDNRLGFDDGDVDDLEEEVAESEEELMACKVAQLKLKLAKRGLIQTGRKPELISRLLNPQPSDFKNKPKIEPWKTSKAKALLIRLLRDKDSTFHLLTPERAWESSEWFKIYPKDRFISNMKNLKRSLEARELIVSNDNKVIEAEIASLSTLDRATNREYPLWHESDASKLLEKDLKDGLKKEMTPLQFQQTREEYLVFPSDVFRKHTYQEQRKQREMPMKITKCNKLAEMQHKNVVDEEAARWHAEQEHDDLVNEMVNLMV